MFLFYRLRFLSRLFLVSEEIMYLSLIAVLLAASVPASHSLHKDPLLSRPVDVFPYAVSALGQIGARRSSNHLLGVIQRASSVCYDELGCFDKEGTFKHLKQLPEPPESVNTQFLLYTRKNKVEPQLLDYKKPDSILKSNLDGSKPLKIVTHGFGGKNNMTWILAMKDAFLQKEDVSVIIIDWSLGAKVPYYIAAAVNSELVGAQAAVLYFFVKDNLGVQEKDLHLVGFSLGAHVVGFIGKRMQALRGTRPARITGLDAASPLFEDYGASVHLSRDDADFVDVVHTNADLLLYGGVGIGKQIGHVDYYPNGGKRQPGCRSTLGSVLTDIFSGEKDRACNHERAVHLFTESILDPSPCEYVGYRCANYSDFELGKCMQCDASDPCGRMGYRVNGTGVYYLLTKKSQPFCADLGKLTVRYPQNVVKSFGSIIFTMIRDNGDKENVTLTSKDEKLSPGEEKVLTVAISRDLSAIQALYLRYDGWITKGKKTFGLASVTIQNSKGEYVYKSCGQDITLTDQEYHTLKQTDGSC